MFRIIGFSIVTIILESMLGSALLTPISVVIGMDWASGNIIQATVEIAAVVAFWRLIFEGLPRGIFLFVVKKTSHDSSKRVAVACLIGTLFSFAISFVLIGPNFPFKIGFDLIPAVVLAGGLIMQLPYYRYRLTAKRLLNF